jgi:uncharacterized protein YqgV (UPF0045/DUF77 family)
LRPHCPEAAQVIESGRREMVIAQCSDLIDPVNLEYRLRNIETVITSPMDGSLKVVKRAGVDFRSAVWG